MRPRFGVGSGVSAPRWLEELETRVLMSADVEPINGVGNNFAHPLWGSAGGDLVRMAPAAYADGVSAPGGTTRPSARVISNAIAAIDHKISNSRNMSAMIFGCHCGGACLGSSVNCVPGGNANCPSGPCSGAAVT